LIRMLLLKRGGLELPHCLQEHAQPGAVDGLAQLEDAACRLLGPPLILEGGLEVRQCWR
jgi:hypothetical protein